MKKTYLDNLTLYAGVDNIPGGLVLKDFAGEAYLAELVDGDALIADGGESLLPRINAVINDPDAEWYDLDGEDNAYIANLLEEIGCSDVDIPMDADEMTLMVQDWLSDHDGEMDDLIIDWDTVGFDLEHGWRIFARDKECAYVLVQRNGYVYIHYSGAI